MRNQVLSSSAELIKIFEGFRQKVYKCTAGVDTIGYGTTIYPQGKRVTSKDKPIDEATAHEYLMDHLNMMYDTIFGIVVTNDELEVHHMVVIMQFVYNLGLTRLKNQTLLRKINTDKLDDVPRELSKWIYQGGKITKGLVRRRNAEIRIWCS